MTDDHLQSKSNAGNKATEISTFVEALVSISKLLVVILLILFVFMHWSYFSDWAKAINHAEFFGVKLDRKEAERYIQAFKSRDQAFNTDWLNAALKEADLLAPAIQGAKIVWVDQNPHNNKDERELLQELGVQVQVVWSTEQLLDFLKEGMTPDLVISNMMRGREGNPSQSLSKCSAAYLGFPDEALKPRFSSNVWLLNDYTQKSPPAGLSMAEILANKYPDIFFVPQRPRIIYYSASAGGNLFSPCAIVATNRADVLLEQTIGALATIRWRELKDFTLSNIKALCQTPGSPSCEKK